jgi:hypothetical protein
VVSFFNAVLLHFTRYPINEDITGLLLLLLPPVIIVGIAVIIYFVIRKGRKA